MDCCDIYTEQFDDDSAVGQAQRYREHGLRGTARMMRDVLIDRGVGGRTVIEFGGGVGGLSLELVKAGAVSAINVELSTAYRKAASALALEAGVEERIELVAGDAVDMAGTIGPADIVVMNRVVCCYPDGTELMHAAARNAAALLAVSYPSIHVGSRVVIGFENWLRSRRGSGFRAFVHPRETMDIPAGIGFEEIHHRTRPVWSVGIWERIGTH
jgi:magnesium-protoporphyrin O-methyltransferase